MAGIPNWVATNTAIPTLQNATTHVVVTVNGTHLTVWVAGVQVLSTSVADLPPLADLVFTAATGGLTDSFVVQHLAVTQSSLTPTSSWTRMGTAAMSGANFALTNSATTFEAGSAVAPVALPTDGMTVNFDADIGGGTGANGMTLTFASPTSPTFLGQAGGSLGDQGISGVAVGLSNFKQGADPSGNFVGIADGVRWPAFPTGWPPTPPSPPCRTPPPTCR